MFGLQTLQLSPAEPGCPPPLPPARSAPASAAQPCLLQPGHSAPAWPSPAPAQQAYLRQVHPCRSRGEPSSHDEGTHKGQKGAVEHAPERVLEGINMRTGWRTCSKVAPKTRQETHSESINAFPLETKGGRCPQRPMLTSLCMSLSPPAMGTLGPRPLGVSCGPLAF